MTQPDRELTELRVSRQMANLLWACLHWRRMRKMALTVEHELPSDAVRQWQQLFAAEERLYDAVQTYFTGEKVAGRDIVADDLADV